MNPIATIPTKQSPLDERRAYMADLHVTLMHGESWYGILKEPPVREPKPILSWKDEAVLAILAEGPAYKAVIGARLEDENESVMDNLWRLSHEAMIVGKPGAVPGTILWHITPLGRRTHSAQAGRVKARDMRVRTSPHRQSEQTAKPGPVAKPDDYLYTGARILTPNQVAAESGECTVYLPNPKTGIPEIVKIIPMDEQTPPLEKFGGSRPLYKTILDDPRLPEAIRLYKDVGLRHREVSTRLHISRQRLRDMFAAAGVEIRKKGTKMAPRRGEHHGV